MHCFCTLQTPAYLPSFSRGKLRSHEKSQQQSKQKKSDVETYERDIICLPHDHPNNSGVFAYPRGKVRTQLAQCGLIGEISIHSWMEEDDIMAEV